MRYDMAMRSRRRHSRRVTGIATIEVVIATGLIIPSLFYLLYVGLRAMSAFLALLGTMIGSPLG